MTNIQAQIHLLHTVPICTVSDPLQQQAPYILCVPSPILTHNTSMLQGKVHKLVHKYCYIKVTQDPDCLCFFFLPWSDWVLEGHISVQKPDHGSGSGRTEVASNTIQWQQLESAYYLYRPLMDIFATGNQFRQQMAKQSRRKAMTQEGIDALK